LGLHGKDRYVLEAIKEFKNCGIITTAGIKSGFFFSYQIKANADFLEIHSISGYLAISKYSYSFLEISLAYNERSRLSRL